MVLYQKVLPDSETANFFGMCRTKLAYVIGIGL